MEINLLALVGIIVFVGILVLYIHANIKMWLKYKTLVKPSKLPQEYLLMAAINTVIFIVILVILLTIVGSWLSTITIVID